MMNTLQDDQTATAAGRGSLEERPTSSRQSHDLSSLCLPLCSAEKLYNIIMEIVKLWLHGSQYSGKSLDRNPRVGLSQW